MIGVYFHNRVAVGDVPAGITVSRQSKLPSGDFRITEYVWGPTSLWFLDKDKFTAEEREQCCRAYLQQIVAEKVEQ